MSSLKVQILKAHKILVGSVGVATLSFLGTACRSAVSNLMAAPSCEVAPNASYCIGPRPDAKADTQMNAPPGTAPDSAIHQQRRSAQRRELATTSAMADPAMRPWIRRTPPATRSRTPPCRTPACRPREHRRARMWSRCSSFELLGGALRAAAYQRVRPGEVERHALGYRSTSPASTKELPGGRRAQGLDRLRVSGAPHRRRVRIDAARARRGARAPGPGGDGGALPARRDRSRRAVRSRGHRARRRHRAAPRPREPVPRPQLVAATRCCAPRIS